MESILIAMGLDYVIGDPKGWPHPVIAIGRLIGKLEKILNKGRYKKLKGFVLVGLVLAIVASMSILIEMVSGVNSLLHLIVLAIGIHLGLAYRSLVTAADEVYLALKAGDISQARLKVSYIVGRDTDHLTEEEIIKATVETVAENTIDGVIAPLFYAILGQVLCGMPLVFIWVYKAINTMDSMVGYKNDRYREFGYAGAKLDDLANYIPARLGSLSMILAGIFRKNCLQGLKMYRRDRHNHKSPNSAHGESVVAGFLGIQLGGNSNYFGKVVEKPTIGDPDRDVVYQDIRRTEGILKDTCVLLFILIAMVWFLTI